MTGARISYGKLAVPVHCVGVAPLRGLPEIPESPVRALDTGLLALRGEHGGARAGLPRRLHRGRQPRRRRDGHDEERDPAPRARVRRRGAGGLPRRARPALPRHLPGDGGAAAGGARAAVRAGARRRGAERSDRLFSLGGGDHGVAELELSRATGSRSAARSGQVGLRLLKTTGSAFTRFARDDATTLPERADRPLFIHLDVHWRYADPADALAATRRATSRPRRCATSSATVFHEFVSRVDPAPRARDGAAAARALPGARGGVVRRAEPHARPRAGLRPGRGPARVHGRVPRLGPDHADRSTR